MQSLFLLFLFQIVCGELYTIEIEVINVAPENGTSLTPVWVGFHDGSFDTFSPDSPVSPQVERLVEDGNTEPLSEFFLSQSDDDEDFITGTIISDNTVERVIEHSKTGTEYFVIDSEKHRFLSLLSMVVPSNDAFVGNSEPRQYQLFDDDENLFIDRTILWDGSNVWDAGSEVNDEIPENTNFYGQTVPNTGVTENSVVMKHPGLLPPGSGGIVDQPQFENAGFTVDDDDYIIARISVSSLFVNAPLYASYSPAEVESVAFGEKLVIDLLLIVMFVLFLM